MSIKILILLAKSMLGPLGKVHVDLYIGYSQGKAKGQKLSLVGIMSLMGPIKI